MSVSNGYNPQFPGATGSAMSTPVTAGGALMINLGGGATPDIYAGSGVPTISASQGSLYLRSDGSSTSTRLYVNTNGTTGWTAVTTAS